MGQVQAEIRFLVDFHHHNGGTAKLAALSNAERQTFVDDCAEQLHGKKLVEYIELGQSDTFRPFLTFEFGTHHPSEAMIHAALVTAVEEYNLRAFPLKFSPELMPEGHEHDATVATPPYSCVQYIWVNGVLVARYNYDLKVIGGTAPKAPNGLVGSYRIALSYS